MTTYKTPAAEEQGRVRCTRAGRWGGALRRTRAWGGMVTCTKEGEWG